MSERSGVPIIIDDEVKDWFMAMCQCFADAKLVVEDNGATESASIFLPEVLQKEFTWGKQFATVQYMGGPTIKPASFDTFEVRFFREGLQKAGLEECVKAKKSMRKEEHNKPNPYYHYNVFDLEDFNKYVKPILLDIEQRLCVRLGNIYSQLSMPAVPSTLRELPRNAKAK